MEQIGLDRDHGLHNDVFDLEKQGVHVVALLTETVHDGLEGSLVAFIVQGVL